MIKKKKKKKVGIKIFKELLMLVVSCMATLRETFSPYMSVIIVVLNIEYFMKKSRKYFNTYVWYVCIYDFIFIIFMHERHSLINACFNNDA